MQVDLKLEIEPERGLAGIQFGMTPDEVRQVLGSTAQTFRKSPSDALETDYFDALGIQVFYKQPGICEAIELAAPAKPTFKGKDLLGKPFSELRDWFQLIDRDVAIDETGLTSHRFGVGLYAPFAATVPDEPIESVIVFEQGYYDSQG
jgi:hypothetical protein